MLERKISQAKLAKLLGVVEGTIQNYEHGRTEPNITRLYDAKRLRTLADTIDDHAHEIGGIGPASMHSIAAIIRQSIETKSIEAKPTEPVEDPIGPEAICRRILAARELDAEIRAIPPGGSRGSQHARVLRLIHGDPNRADQPADIAAAERCDGPREPGKSSPKHRGRSGHDHADR